MDKTEFTTTELADLAKANGLIMPPRMIDRLCQTGQLPARRVGAGKRGVWMISAETAQRWMHDWLAKVGATAAAVDRGES